jgi:hypothetical protein
MTDHRDCGLKALKAREDFVGFVEVGHRKRPCR